MSASNPAEETIVLNTDKDNPDFFSPFIENEKELASEYRRRRSTFIFKSVHQADASMEVEKGWSIQRPGKRTTRLKKEKNHDKRLEDRVWCLLYSMGYRAINGENFKISFRRRDLSTGRKQVDVYAEDSETAIIVECKSKSERGHRSLQKDIQATISLKEYFRNEIYKRFDAKPRVIWIYVTRNIIWSEPDTERSQAGDIKIVTENELQYFETFVKHMGPAAKYQILGEFLKNQKIPGLTDNILPAIRGKIGGEVFYSFVTTPRNLLKIAYINHQALNHPDGRPAYQRMISSKRIKEIGSFIEKGGYFPTNILVNFVKKPRFDLISNSENTDPNIKFGWLTLPSTYKSAWIIDGQHRLYGFSHLKDKNLDRSLFVLAFQEMDNEKEADLFITINHKQKSVPKSLLVSLLADIRLGDSDPSTALSALGSAIVRRLNTDITSPLVRRFALPDVPPEPNQNLTMSEAVNGLRRSTLIGKVAGRTLVPGSLSGAVDVETVERASKVLKIYFEALRVANPVRWEAGRDAYVATNPGFRAHLNIIAEIKSYLTHKRSIDFDLMKEEEFANYIVDFARPIFSFIGDASDEEIRNRFSRKFGEGGVKEYTYRLMEILAETHNDFGPDEFRRWMEQSASEKVDEINNFLMKFSERLTNFVIDTLKGVYGTYRLPSDEPAYWEIGVESERIRRNAFEAQQRDKTRRSRKEAYLNIVDLSEIVKQKNNWPHFEHVFQNPCAGDKRGQKYYLSWVIKFSELRNIAAHKNRLRTYTDEDLEFVDWLRTEVSPKVP